MSFGKNVLVDSITIYIRADFPHDGYWFKGMFNFSDGSKLPFVLDSTARPQSFKFTQRTTNYVLIDSLVWRQPATWCAFTQVQVFGYEGVGILPCVNSGMNRNLDKHTLILAEPGPVLDIKNGAAPASFYSLSGRRMAAAPVLMVKEKFNGTSAH